MDVGTFITQAFEVVKDFRTLTPHLQMIGILTLIISAWKVSAFRPYWDKIGSAKTLVAPAAMILLSVINSLNGPMNLHVILNAIMIGLGSVGFHELLDCLKKLPHIGPRWLVAVNVLSDLTQNMSRKLVYRKKL